MQVPTSDVGSIIRFLDYTKAQETFPGLESEMRDEPWAEVLMTDKCTVACVEPDSASALLPAKVGSTPSSVCLYDIIA